MTERESLIWAYRQLQAFGALTSSEEGRQVGQRLMQMADRMAQEWPPGVKVGDKAQRFPRLGTGTPEEVGSPGDGTDPAAGNLRTAIEEAVASLEAGMVDGAVWQLKEALRASPGVAIPAELSGKPVTEGRHAKT